MLRLIRPDGAELQRVPEWVPLLVEACIPHPEWSEAEVRRGSDLMPLALRRVGGEPRVVAEWPRTGPGNYELRLVAPSGSATRTVVVEPEKLSRSSYALLLEDLETRLPASVALGLQRAGGLSGLSLLPPQESTVAEEVHRLRRAILGTSDRPGLSTLLPEVARDPHRMLANTELWVRRGRARRPHPARLAHARARAGNLDVDWKPVRVLDTRVEHTFDVYENRLLRTYAEQVGGRLRRLRRIPLPASVATEIDVLGGSLRRAQGAAKFLREVRELDHAPRNVTMVLLKRSAYRAALEGYLEFQQRVSVRLEDAALDAPLENLPYLYQLWGTLGIIDALLHTAVAAGYRLVRERLIVRAGGTAFLRVLPKRGPAVVLAHPESGTELRLISERSYVTTRAADLWSITYTQRPDVALEIRATGTPPRVLLFDPKYKLDGEPLEEGAGPKPKKVDLDKMHAYRDAIRDQDGRRVVEYAAILYPGPEHRYPYGIEALSADPAAAGALDARLRDRFSTVLGQRLDHEAVL